MMTEEELKEIEAREKNAMPGMWQAWWEDYGEPMVVVVPAGQTVCVLSTGTLAGAYDINAIIGTGDFIAHAREDIPRLIAEVRRLNEELENRCFECKRVDIVPGTWVPE